MVLGVIGRGRWAQVYARTLTRMGIDYRIAGRSWRNEGWCESGIDGVVIASTPASHFAIAHELIQRRVPVLIEKPVSLSMRDASELLRLARAQGGIAFAGNTRLYSPAWRRFKREALAAGVTSVAASAGSTDTGLGPWWDWGGHLVAMCLDLGADPDAAALETVDRDLPLTFRVNGILEYRDVQESPLPLDQLLTEFLGAISRGTPDSAGLELGARTVEVLERRGSPR